MDLQKLIACMNGVSKEWKLCRRANGRFEVEAYFNGDNGWSRCGESLTVYGAIWIALRLVPGGICHGAG